MRDDLTDELSDSEDAPDALLPADDIEAAASEFEATDGAIALDEASPVETGRGEASGLGYAREKVRGFPQTPGVYLFKDRQGRVIYVGKAVNLRSRAGSYFTRPAATDRRTAELVRTIGDVDHIPCDSEVDALLTEARLIKDLRPQFNSDLKDDKTFPYLQITTHEDFPRVEITRTPRTSGVKLYGPFTKPGKLRGAVAVLQKVFKFRTCTLDIDEGDDRWRWFRPCLLHSINQCTAPCNLRISKEEYRQDVKRLRMILDGNKTKLVASMQAEMNEASKNLQFEKAARLRDEVVALESLSLRGNLEDHAQPEVFYIDPQKGLAGLKQVFKLEKQPRVVEGVDIAHLQGGETVASLVQFIDGLPFKHGYKRYKIRAVEGVDDFASMREVVSRRLRRLRNEGDPFPDILLIDGGKGQLNAAIDAMQAIGLEEHERPFTIGLAKREEEIYVPGENEPRRLSRHSYALRLLQYVRDEAHRFAQHYHHLLRHKSTFDETTGKWRGMTSSLKGMLALTNRGDSRCLPSPTVSSLKSDCESPRVANRSGCWPICFRRRVNGTKNDIFR